MLPNFLIIGAMKSGTTSLFHYVKDHPQVFLADHKEVRFFSRDDWRDKMEWYESHFASACEAIAVGEASTTYTKYPLVPGVPERIARTVPQMKLIYVLRDPIDRARSHYLHAILRGSERRPIDVALRSDPRYLDVSRYAMQIERYLGSFPREQLLLLLSDDLLTNRVATVQRVYDFLGVDSAVVPGSIGYEFYRTEKRRGRHPRLRLRRRTWYRPAVDCIPLGIRRAVWRRLERWTTVRADLKRAQVSAELRGELQQRLHDDISELRAHLPPEFDGWGIA